MSDEVQAEGAWQDRFPGFSATGQARHWDEATRKVVLARLDPPAPMRLLPEQVRGTGVALVAQLIAVDDDRAFELLSSIDARLAGGELDGWHYDDMPIDTDGWPRSLTALDATAQQEHGAVFADLAEDGQHDLLERIRTSDADTWHGMPPAKVWNLWMRYVTAAYYSHPAAWDEMGFPGPAYPRGYKNPGIDAREPFEVRDVHPRMDPTVTSEL